MNKYTLRRLSKFEIGENITKEHITKFKNEINEIKLKLGEDYISELENRVSQNIIEVIVAIENISFTT